MEPGNKSEQLKPSPSLRVRPTLQHRLSEEMDYLKTEGTEDNKPVLQLSSGQLRTPSAGLRLGSLRPKAPLSRGETSTRNFVVVASNMPTDRFDPM